VISDLLERAIQRALNLTQVEMTPEARAELLRLRLDLEAIRDYLNGGVR